LDFTHQKNTPLAKLPTKIKKDLELYGIPSSLKIISDHSNSFSFRVSAQGPLFNQQIDQCFIKVEISSRETLVVKPKTFFIKPDYPNQLPFSVIVMDASEILAEKFRALLSRNKARDIYDIWFLLEHGIDISIKLIDKKLEYYNTKFQKQQVNDAIRAKKVVWERELRPIIIGELPKFEIVEKKILENLARF
jgi:predicted nucleotidyltransferase component of viral defense system